MAMSKLPILKPVTTGYSDALRTLRAMPVLAGFTFLIMLAISLAEYVVPEGARDEPLLANLIGFALSAAQSFFLTPIMIAVHRFIILDEVTPRYVLEPARRVFQVFFGWLLVLSVIGLLAVLIFALADVRAGFSLGVVLVAMVVFIAVTTRLSILLPAIAVEAPGASAANAWADSKQHMFRVLMILILAAVPIFVGALFLMFPFVLAADPDSGTLGLPATIVMAAVQMFGVILFVAIASRLYQALADRLLGAPGQGA